MNTNKFKLTKFSLLLLTILFLNSCQKESKKVATKVDVKELEAIFPTGTKGSDSLFTGNAYNYSLVIPDSTCNTLVGNVYFEPGARSNWHSHPAGQILIITDGVGYHQIEGQPLEIIKKGDVVKCPPNVKHWHGASHDVGLQQLYIVPNTEKGIVDWQEKVTDEFYKKTSYEKE